MRGDMKIEETIEGYIQNGVYESFRFCLFYEEILFLSSFQDRWE